MAERGTGKRPAYSWYPKDAETDEAYRLMTCEELGVYERLRDCQWLEGSLPTSLDDLAILIGHRMTRRRLEFIWPKIAPCFPEDGHGRLANPKLEKQRDELAAYIASKKISGRAGGLAKAKQNSSTATNSLVANPTSAFASASASAEKREERPPARTGSGAMGGELPRDHLRHAVCGRMCLHEKQFAEFVQKIGGGTEAATETVRAWAKSILREWGDDGPKRNAVIQGTSFQFWNVRYEEWQGSPQAVKGAAKLPGAREAWTCPHAPLCSHPTKCQQLIAIAAEKARAS